ncbi:MAG: S26 family signal peptidase, partial [Cyanobacteria bacterium J06632_22]
MNQGHSPWLPVNLSLVWPGLGHIYQQQWLLGVTLATLFLGCSSRSGWEIFAANGQTRWGFIYLTASVLIYAISPWLAYRLHGQWSPPHQQPVSHLTPSRPALTQRVSHGAPKDPWYSLFLEHFLPGMGHLYIGQTLLGGTLLLLGVGLAYAANNVTLSLLPLAYSIWAIGGYHAYRATRNLLPQRWRINLGADHPAARQTWAILIVSGVMMLKLFIGYTPTWINQTVLQCIVPSTSMQPTLQVDDRIFVSRHRQYQPRQGDIVVFLPTASAIQTLKADPTTLF